MKDPFSFLHETILLPPGVIDSKHLIQQDAIKQKLKEMAIRRKNPQVHPSEYPFYF